jgi:hypothetical protein
MRKPIHFPFKPANSQAQIAYEGGYDPFWGSFDVASDVGEWRQG